MLTVYTAKTVITMNASMPRASAVAVRGGRIVEVGDLTSMKPWLDANEHRIDPRFSNDVITPGFIDPHLHPTMAAVLLPMHFITAMEWKLPWGTVAPVTTAQGFADRVHALHAELGDGEPLFIWGYHQLWHGDIRGHPDKPASSG